MKNSKKRILLSIIATILMITVLFVGKVNATTYSIYSVEKMKNNGTIGQTMWLDGGDLRKRNDVYCFEHKTAFLGGEYRISDIVEISGKTATSKGTGKSNTRNENATMNYILTEGNYSKWMFTDGGVGMSVRNIAIWGYQNKWLNSLPNGFFLKNWKHKYSRYNMDDYDFGNQGRSKIEDAKKLVKEAENYAKGNIGKAEAEIVGASTVKEYVKNQYGPFKIKYKGDKISISVFDLNGKAVADRYIKVYSDKDCKKEISKANIKSSTNFYVRITNGAKIKSLKCKVTSNLISAKIFFLGRSDFWNGVGQGIIFVKPGKTPTEKTVEFDIRLLQKVSIKGYVWIDVQRTKQHDWDSLYNGDEARVEGVTVNLVNKASKKVIATVKTNSNGEYIFDKPFYEDELKDYYVEFNYSGTQYKNYIPVAFNSTNANEIVANGSRALVNEMPTADDKVNGIATTYPGTQKENIYGLGGNLYNKLYNDNTKTLENINLGIRQLHTPQYDITENLAYVKLTIKGYTYNYIYGGVDGPNRINAPKVSFQKKNDIAGYTRAIYPSDIVYNPEDATQKLKVSVIYRIDIKNTENQDVEDQYREKKLHITNIVNEFDTSRYDLNDNNWEANGNTATIKQNYLKEKYGNGIEKNQTSTSFIEFSVKEAAIKDILKHPEGIIEEFPTKVTSVGYHEYTRNDYSWKNDLIKEQTHTTPYDQRSSEAPYLIFKLGEQRTLTGTVFEDTVVTNNGEKLGNGTFENNNENVVGNVKVELLDVEEGKTLANLPVSHLYNIKDATDGTKDADITEAMVITDNKGNYTLSGLVPGYYFIRFTYGDGTQKIYDVNGNEVSTVLSKDYKSTIVTSEAARNALGFTDNQYKEVWYKHLEGMNYSVAVDDLDTRKIANTTNTAEKSVNVVAGTAKVSITIENTENDNSTNIEVKDNQQIEVPNKSKFEGFNLGIIRQPNQEAKLEKVVSNMKLTNAQNNIVFDGNPQTAKMQGVSDLDNDKNNGGSAYVRAEIKEENIYGSTLELKYAIKVTNISDVNYYSDNYYKFGDKTNAYEVTLKIEEVTDYLDEALKYEPDESDATRITLTPDSIEETEGDKTTKKYLVKITDWKTLYTENNKERKAQKDTSDAVTLGTQRYLSSEESDMEFVNEAEITKLANQTDPDDNSQDKAEKLVRTAPVEVHTNGKVKAVVTITPPTGLDRITIILYAVAGAVTLAILSAGVVIIKKKVL